MNISQVWPEWNEDCVLGEGSFGKVYRAKRVEYGRTFYSAIKVLTVPKSQQEIKFARSQGMNDSEIYDYFRGLVDNLLNEITLMDNLKGAKNIVGIEDYKIIERQGEIGWDIFIRMELLTPFDSFVSNPDFSQKDVIRLGVDICTALEVCEQNYILHRDIKPDNIFISRFGEYKLGDFGIARKLEATQANLSRKGTLNYMAPEVYKSEEYGSNVDIYSLGLVLYTLLNNNRIAFLPPYPQPISYKDNEEALSKRLSGMPLTYPCNASASLGEVIVKACAYKPSDRYQTATEFKNALIAEWNTIVQSGDNKQIGSDAMRFDSNLDQKLQSTTNDMTANGRLVVDEYSQGTTVLEQPNFNSLNNNTSGSYSNEISVDIPQYYSTSKSNKVCKILSYPIALAMLILGIFALISNHKTLGDTALGISFLSLAFGIIAAPYNKYSAGISSVAISLPYIFIGTTELLNGIQYTFPITSIITLLSGVLILFGGVVLITQKEVRLGGSLCACASAIQVFYALYLAVNKNFSLNFSDLLLCMCALLIFVWSYGYKSDEEIGVVKKIFIAVTTLASCVAAIVTVVSLTA